jgi:hypothetical protein
MILAQALDASGPGPMLPRLAVPTGEELVSWLGSLSLVAALLMLAVGLVYLLQGWKIVKGAIVLNAAAVGALAGGMLGSIIEDDQAWFYGALAGAVLLGTLAWPTYRYTAGAMGGVLGGVMGFATWRYVADTFNRPDLTEHAWAGAVIGLVFLGMLAFVLFRLTIILITSCQGAFMTVGGGVALLMKHHSLSPHVQQGLLGSAHVLAVLLLVPSAIGLIVQDAAAIKKANKKRKSGGSGGSGGS